MSVINRVLKDLDRNRAMSGTPSGVRAVAVKRSSASIWIWIVLAALLLGSAAAFLFRQYRIQPVQVAAPPPVQAVPATPPAPPEPAAVVEVAPEAVGAQLLPVPSPLPPPEPAAKKAVPRSLAKPPLQALEPVPPALLPDKPRVIKEPSLSTPQSSANTAFNEAKRFIEQGRTREAIDKLNLALSQHPAHLLARQTLVALLADHDEMLRAELLLREGAALHPGEIWFAQAAGQLLVRQGNYTAAAATLKEGLSRGGADGPYWAFLAGVQNKLGRMDEAVYAYRQAVRMHTDNGTWWVGLAVALERQGQKDEARTAYQQAYRTKLNPELKDFVSQKMAELAK